MFRIFSFRQLAVLTAIICVILLSGATLSLVAPVACATPETGVRVPIIMYHQISENEKVIGDYAIPLELLEEDFLYMKANNITPVSFKQLEDFTKKGVPLPEKPIVITFDDGQKTFLTKVLPLLEKYNFPANVNVIGALSLFYTQIQDNNDSYAYLNVEDLKTLCNNPLVEIGCHTYNLHTLGNRRGAEKLQAESIADYKKFIEHDLKCFDDFFSTVSDKSTLIFAYPYGIRNDLLQDILTESGFTVTLTCRESVNLLSVGSSLFELGRFNRPFKTSTESFFAKMF